MIKKSLIYIILTTTFLYNCNSTEISQETPCNYNKDLEVNESFKYYEGELWTWKINDNILTITAKTDWSVCEQFERKISFNINSECLRIIRNFRYSCSCDAECLEPLEEFSKELIIKKWDKNSCIIGKSGNTFFWVEFNKNNKSP